MVAVCQLLTQWRVKILSCGEDGKPPMTGGSPREIANGDGEQAELLCGCLPGPLAAAPEGSR